MFNAGDMVRVLENGAQAEVLEVDGNTVYVEMMNGVEHDYSADKLMSEEDFAARLEAERDLAKDFHEKQQVKTEANMFGNYIPQKGDHNLAIKCLDMVNKLNPKLMLFAQYLISDAGKLKEFEDAKPLNKVMMIAEVLGTPTIVWMGAADMNDESMMRSVIVKTLVNNASEFLLFTAKMEISSYEAS